MLRREIAMLNLQAAFVVFLTFSIGVNCVKNFENATEGDSEIKQGAIDYCSLKCGDDPYTYCEGEQETWGTTKCVCPIKTQVLDEYGYSCIPRCIHKCGRDLNIVCSGDQKTDETTICGCKDELNWAYDSIDRQCLRCECGKGEKCAADTFFYKSTRCIKCREGYSNVNGRCEGDCSNSPCKNGGHCKIGADDITCDCIYPFTGRFCEKSVLCDPNPCKNGGTCTAAGNTFKCICPDNYKGRTCSENVFCEKYGKQFCGNATCVVTKNPTEVLCLCYDQIFDKVSRTCVDDPCHPNPCQNGGRCVLADPYYPKGEPYTCSCRSTHKGKNCTESTWCMYNGRSVCGEEATCQYNETLEDFSCICPSNETFDETLKICKGICKPNPCVHGTCIKNGDYSYCSCSDSYIGRYCDEEVIKPCASNPCQNGGKCSSFGPFFVCTCRFFHTGENCDRVNLSMVAVAIVPLGVLIIGIVTTVLVIKKRNEKLKMISQRMAAYRAIQTALPMPPEPSN